ncbi:MAG: hypothetical protein AAFN18_17580 [Cyanobacteria bacterium J06554_6]
MAAALSSLYEFIHSRMMLDDESYTRAVERFQHEVEGDLYTSQLLVTIYEKVLLLLRFEGIKRKGEFYTVKKILDELFNLLGPMLPEEVRQQRNRTPQFATKVSLQEALQIINAFELWLWPLCLGHRVPLSLKHRAPRGTQSRTNVCGDCYRKPGTGNDPSGAEAKRGAE